MSTLALKFRHFWTYRHAVGAFVLADLKVRYRRSALGYLWNLINPLMNLIILAVVFSQVMRVDMPEYPVFLFAAMVPYGFFQNAVVAASASLVRYQHFIRAQATPKIVFPLSLMLACFIDFLLAMIAFFLLSQAFRPWIGWELLWVPVACFNLATLTLGVGLICAVVTVQFRDFSNIVSLLLQAGFFGTPIIYTLEMIPDPTIRTLLWYNPMTHFLQNFRDLFYGVLDEHRVPVPKGLGTETLIATTLGGLFMLTLGLLVFWWKGKRVIERF